jgi:ATPase subunit of ABC transporter with duplicated ATPase domains
VLRQDQFAFDAYRVIDTVIMGNKPLWAALEERDRIYEKPEMTDDDGMRLGELEGVIGDEDGYTAEADAAVLLDRARHSDGDSRAQDGRVARRAEGARAAGAGSVWKARGAAAGRADELSRS